MSDLFFSFVSWLRSVSDKNLCSFVLSSIRGMELSFCLRILPGFLLFVFAFLLLQHATLGDKCIAFLDCFGSCGVTSPLGILAELRRRCTQKREDWDRWIFFDLPEGVYPDYDGAEHECRIDAYNMEYFANYCIEYHYHTKMGGDMPELKSVDQLKELIERGPVLAALKVKRGFRTYQKGLTHVYDTDKDRTPFESELHAVLFMGYKTNGPRTHLLIRNPWLVDNTVQWGEQGYAWIAIDNLAKMKIIEQIYIVKMILPPVP